MGNLSNLYISASFQTLLHTGNNGVLSSSLTDIQDGFGNSSGVSLNNQGDLSLSGSFTASLQNGYVWIGDVNGKTKTVPTASFAGGGSATWPVSGTPSGLVSGSSQVSFTGISNVPSGLLSSSDTSFTPFSQSVDSRINNIVTGTGFATTGSNTFRGTQIISGSLNDLILRNNLGNDIRIHQIVDPAGGNFTDSYIDGIVNYTGVGTLSGINSLNFSSSAYFLQGNTTRAVLGFNNSSDIFGISFDRPYGNTSQFSYIFRSGSLQSFVPLNIGAEISASGPISSSGTLTASLQDGYIWIGDSTNKTIASTGSAVFVSSGSFNTFSQSVDSRIIGISAGTGFATTGSNTFKASQTISGSTGHRGIFFPSEDTLGNSGSFFFGVRSDNYLTLSGSFPNSTSANGMITIQPDNLWIEVNSVTNFNNSTLFRGDATFRNINVDGYNFGYTAKFDNISGSNAYFNNLVVSGSTKITGSIFIQSSSANLPESTGSGVLTYDQSNGQVKFSKFLSLVSGSLSSGEFYSTTTQSGSAGVSGSLTFNNSASLSGVSLVSSSQLTVSNAGTYNVQFSAQIESSAGADTQYIWFKKNGTNIADSATKVLLANNTAQVMTVNLLDEAQAGDYYELGFENKNGNATILAEPASGSVPAIPSVIATITQVR